MKYLSSFFACILLFGVIEGMAQVYPETLWVPVTYYDFHSNGSNPEFQRPHNGGLHRNMVATTLDTDSKPIIGSAPYLNYYIKFS